MALVYEEASRILAERVGVRTPIHYRDWYDLVIGEGFVVVGKRPLSTFLTGASRSSVVKKGHSSGTYLLEPRLLEPLRAQLLELHGELADVEQVAKSDERASLHLRQHAVNLKASIRKLERQIEEGHRAMDTHVRQQHRSMLHRAAQESAVGANHADGETSGPTGRPAVERKVRRDPVVRTALPPGTLGQGVDDAVAVMRARARDSPTSAG